MNEEKMNKELNDGVKIMLVVIAVWFIVHIIL